MRPACALFVLLLVAPAFAQDTSFDEAMPDCSDELSSCRETCSMQYGMEATQRANLGVCFDNCRDARNRCRDLHTQMGRQRAKDRQREEDLRKRASYEEQDRFDALYTKRQDASREDAGTPATALKVAPGQRTAPVPQPHADSVPEKGLQPKPAAVAATPVAPSSSSGKPVALTPPAQTTPSPAPVPVTPAPVVTTPNKAPPTTAGSTNVNKPSVAQPVAPPPPPPEDDEGLASMDDIVEEAAKKAPTKKKTQQPKGYRSVFPNSAKQ